MSIELHWADCFDVFPSIKDQSIDLVLCDPPYGTTSCKWDSVLPLDKMWKEILRVIKNTGVILLFGAEPFSSLLRCSKLDLYKYDWVWKKSKPNGWQHSKNKPMKADEDVLVFSKAPMGHSSLLGINRMPYYPQGIKSKGLGKVSSVKHGKTMGARPNQIGKEYEVFTGFPNNILEYSNVIGIKCLHPTQKPVELLEYLIKTYSLEGETVLDFTMGSGSTGVACKNTNRSFIGIEKEKEYFDIAKQRILTEGVQEPEIDICSMFN